MTPLQKENLNAYLLGLPGKLRAVPGKTQGREKKLKSLKNLYGKPQNLIQLLNFPLWLREFLQ